MEGRNSKSLTFRYQVGAGQNTASLAATAINLNGATVQDNGGNAANLLLNSLAQTGQQIDTAVPTVSSVMASGTGITAGTGDLGAGSVVKLTVTGAPTLSLNYGGTATYAGGTGTNALTFSYTVAPSDSAVSALAITGVNLPSGATIKDAFAPLPDLLGFFRPANVISASRESGSI